MAKVSVGKNGLNPCCSGRWSRTNLISSMPIMRLRLNPCCSGRWSRTGGNLAIRQVSMGVLILVVVEDGLVRDNVQLNAEERTSLNPCCSGRWSRTASYQCDSYFGTRS